MRGESIGGLGAAFLGWNLYMSRHEKRQVNIISPRQTDNSHKQLLFTPVVQGWLNWWNAFWMYLTHQQLLCARQVEAPAMRYFAIGFPHPCNNISNDMWSTFSEGHEAHHWKGCPRHPLGLQTTSLKHLKVFSNLFLKERSSIQTPKL